MKNRLRGYAVLGILFAAISAIAFAVPTEKTAAFWISYGFTIVALAAQLGIWKATLGRKEALNSKFLGFPVLHIGIVYLLLQLAAFVVFLVVPTLTAWGAVAAGAVIAGLSAVCMIAADAGRDEIQRTEAKTQKKILYIKALQADVELLAKQETDPSTQAALLRLAEAIRFSDPMSHEQLADLEAQLAAKVAELKMAAEKADIITELHSLLDERNKRYKTLNSIGRVEECGN